MRVLEDMERSLKKSREKSIIMNTIELNWYGDTLCTSHAHQILLVPVSPQNIEMKKIAIITLSLLEILLFCGMSSRMGMLPSRCLLARVGRVGGG